MNRRSLDAAKQEFADAFEYYDRIGPNLGERFRRAVHAAIIQVLDYPMRWPLIDGEYRHYRMNDFPYRIIYRVDQSANEIIITAFAHVKRRPEYWKGRE